MPKNVVVCCDGTGNQFGDRVSNVVKLYSLLLHEPGRQVLFYDPGVGTTSVHRALESVRKAVVRPVELAFGVGLTKNIEDAYRFIMDTYEDGDRLFLFGFSRGAFTVRGVAGLLHKVGLLKKRNGNLVPYALRVFKRGWKESTVAGFRRTFCNPCPIHVLGLWDTVTSVGWVWDPLRLPFTTNNDAVRVVRHAVSIDERRAFFRQNLWGRSRSADIKQVWFPGVHSDVGGGYADDESGLANLSLEWMLTECRDHGLVVNEPAAEEALSKDWRPDPQAVLHRSLSGFWWPAEVFPKLYYRGRGRPRGVRLNLGRPRRLPLGSLVHQSVFDRHDYSPPNLPGTYEVVPRVPFGDR